MASVKYQHKAKGKSFYETEWVNDNEKEVYMELSQELISKKLCQCTWIRSITRRNNYDGTVTITVNYKADSFGIGRRVYTVKG